MVDRVLVLVTRTGLAGEELVRRLRGAGWNAIHCPPVQLAGPVDEQAVAESLASLLPVDRIIMTSGEAIAQTATLIGSDTVADTPVIVPGPGSALQARERGFRNVLSPPTAGNSEAMLTLPELDKVDGLSVLILAAAGGRRLLESELRRRKATVHRVHVYRRLDQPLPEGLEQSIQGAAGLVTLISSGGALEALEKRLSADVWSRVAAGRVVVPSQRVLDLAVDKGCLDVVNAGGADDDSMLAAMDGPTRTDQLR